MHFHFYVTCYTYYDNVKLEIHHVPAVSDLRTSTGKHIITLSNVALDSPIQ